MASRSHENEDLHKRYMAARGCSLRTAQRHSATEHPEWQAWRHQDHLAIVTGTKKKSSPGNDMAAPSDAGRALRRIEAPPALLTPEGERSPEEHVEVLMYNALLDTNEQAASTDTIITLGAYRTLAQVLPKYLAAKRAREQAEERARKVVPIEDFHLTTVLVRRMATVYEGIEELASRLNPSDPNLARQVLSDWRARSVVPAVQAVIDDCDKHRLAPPASLAA